MDGFPYFSAFVFRAQEKDGRTCINGLPVASPAKEMLGRFPRLQALSHSNLAVYLHFAETVIARDLVIIVQESFQKTLTDVISLLTNSDKEVCMMEIGYAIEYLHQQGIIHGSLNLDSIHYCEKDGKSTVKLTKYGLPFLTDNGETIGSSMCPEFFLSPERLLTLYDSQYCDTMFQSDTWAMGIAFLQIYLGVDFKKTITDQEYVDILNKAETPEGSVMHEIICLLNNKKVIIGSTQQLDWMKDIINDCLNMQYWKRPQIPEVMAAIRSKSKINNDVPKLQYKLRSVQEMREQIRNSRKKPGFEQLSIFDTFYLWKLCGSSPEKILLKSGMIQNHASISSYPFVLYDDYHYAFSEDDEMVDEQSTCTQGFFELPRNHVEARLEENQQISAKLFSDLGVRRDNEHHNNIIYEKTLNMLTVAHILNAQSEYGLSGVISKLASTQIVSTQRGDVWRELLQVTQADWRKYLDLDILQPHYSERQLEVDIPRCHQYDSFMTTPAIQESLRKVLKGWQMLTENENYVYWQGCDSLATPFVLANMSSPHIAYACFHKFANRYCHKFFLKDNSEVIKEYLGIFYHLVAYTDPVLYKHLKNNGFDAELFAIPWFLTCFAHELPLSKLVLLWDEMIMHGNQFPLMVALAMLNRLREKLLAVNFNEMIIIIHDQPDLSIEDVIKTARMYNNVIPPSCAFRIHASDWKEPLGEVHQLPMSIQGLSLNELAALHCPRLSTEELVWRVENGSIFILDTRSDVEFHSGHFKGAYSHPSNLQADIEWLARIPGIGASNWPKCIVYNDNDTEAAKNLAEVYVMKGVPQICILHEGYESVKEHCPTVVTKC